VGMTFSGRVKLKGQEDNMLKRFLLSTSAFVFAGGLALAQAPTVQASSVAVPRSSSSMVRLLASDIYRANVYDNSENKIGDVTDLVINNDGNITTTVIGVGGFLGVGQKDIAVPFRDLKISSRDGKEWLTLTRTKDELRSMPRYQPMGRSVATSASSSMANWLVSDIYKANVYDNSEHKIGVVTDLVLDNEGNITTAVIGVGGALGAGQKEVAVAFKDLKISSRDGKDWLVLNRTKDDLKNAPAFDKKSETDKM
jgi:sporulation protein YlmC with PRC-barrel domain